MGFLWVFNNGFKGLVGLWDGTGWDGTGRDGTADNFGLAAVNRFGIAHRPCICLFEKRSLQRVLINFRLWEIK